MASICILGHVNTLTFMEKHIARFCFPKSFCDSLHIFLENLMLGHEWIRVAVYSQQIFRTVFAVVQQDFF
jgi:hypothetical protein